MEGKRLLSEIVRAEAPALLLLHTDHLAEGDRALANQIARLGASVEVVTDEVMIACTATGHNQGLLAVLPLPELALPEQIALGLVCDRVGDPGNLGTLMRTAEAAGVDAVLCAPGTVDVFNPKVVRAAAGAHLRLPIVIADWHGIEERVANCTCWLASSSDGTPYDAVDWMRPAALIVSSEAHGGSQKAQQLAAGRVHVPMQGQAESLNVAVAAGVILMEAARQKRIQGSAWSTNQTAEV